MPKSARKSHAFKIGDRVIYTKNNKKTECWIEKFDNPYIVLRPCFKSSENVVIHQLVRDSNHYIKKFRGRNPKLKQHVLFDNYNVTKAIIIDIEENNMTIQILGTRINHKVHINCCSIKLLDTFNTAYIPYFPINLKKTPPFLYKDVMINEMRGKICDYDELHNMYLFLYWENGVQQIKWVRPDFNMNKPRVKEDKLNHVHTYEIKFKSIYPENSIDFILKHAPKLILMDFMKNMSWWNSRSLQKLLELYFVSHYHCKLFNSFIKIEFLDQTILDELIKHVNEEEKVFLTHQYMSNLKPGMSGNYKYSTELLYRAKPFFDLKVSRRNENFVVDVFFNESLPIKYTSLHFSDYLINPVVLAFNPNIQNKYIAWGEVETSSMNFWENYWDNQQILNIKHDFLFAHQVWAVNKMQQMETEDISNMFNFKIWNKNFNILSGFIEPSRPSYGGVLALDTGLGKTVCCIELIKRNPSKTLIVVPLTLLDQWKLEIQNYFPEASVSEFYGKKKCADGLIVLTTYGTLIQNIPPAIDRVIFDECHTLKSCYSSTAVACSYVKAPKRWCLTATPFGNSLESIQSFFKVLNISPWTNYSIHMDKLINGNRPALGHMISKLFIRLKKQTLTKLNINPIGTTIKYKHTHLDMTPDHISLFDYFKNELKTQVKELMSCPKNYYKLLKMYNQLHMLSLDPKLLSMDYYGKFLAGGMNKKTIDSIETCNTFQKHVIKNFDDNDQCCVCMCPYTRPTMTPCFHIFCNECITTSLRFNRKCPQCRAPLQKNGLTEMVKKMEVKEDNNVVTFYDIHNNLKEIPKSIHNIYNKDIVPNKMNYIINKIKKKSHMSFIIFSQFNNCLQHIKKALINNNITVDIINGTKTRIQRKEAIEKFKQKKVQVFLLSTKTASIGLTLTTSYHMFFVEPILDAQIFKQAVGRIFRIGQKNNVTIETLYSKNSIENKQKIDNFKKNILNKKNSQIKKMKMIYLHSMLVMD